MPLPRVDTAPPTFCTTAPASCTVCELTPGMFCEPAEEPIDETVEPIALTMPPPSAAILPIALALAVPPESEPEPLDPVAPPVPLVPVVPPADESLPPPEAPLSELASELLPPFDPSP